MTNFKINPDLIHKIESAELLMTFTDPDRNEIYTFEGPASLILQKCLKLPSINPEIFAQLALPFEASTEEIEGLWKYCLDQKIFLSA